MTDNTMDKRKRTNNDLENIIHKTNDRATRTPQKTGGDLRCSGWVSSSCSTIVTLRITVKWHQNHLTWKSCWTPVCVNKYKKQVKRESSFNVWNLSLISLTFSTKFFFSSLPGYFILSLTFLRPYIFWNVHDFSTFCENIRGCLKSWSEMPGYGKHLL